MTEISSPFAQIYSALQKLVSLHRQLLDCVRAERDALVQAGVKQIQDQTLAKQLLLESIRIAELERMRAMETLAKRWSRPAGQITLSQIIIHLQGDGPESEPKAAEQFRSSLNALTILVQRIRDQNDDNRALVEQSLLHVEKMKRNVLGEAQPKANTYNSQGRGANAAPGARLISKEV